MKIHSKMFKISLFISVLFLFISYWLDCIKNSIDKNYIEFFFTICIAISTGFIITTITSIISYFAIKKETAEQFYFNAQSILYDLKNYNMDWSIDEKFLYIRHMEKQNYNTFKIVSGQIYFLINHKAKYSYIIHFIYNPIMNILSKIDITSQNIDRFYNPYTHTECDTKIKKMYIVTLENYINDYNKLYYSNSKNNNFFDNLLEEELNKRFQKYCTTISSIE